MRIRQVAKGLPWRGVGASLLVIGGMAALMGGVGYAYLSQEFGPRSSAIGGALMGLAGVCFILAARLMGFTMTGGDR